MYVCTYVGFYTNYIASVYAVSGGGSGPVNSRSFTSQEGPPSSPPQNVMTTVRDSQSITITWSPPPVNARNGVIRSYNVTVNERSTRVDCCLHMETGLTPYTNYSVRVAAVTTEQGVFSDTVTKQTDIAGVLVCLCSILFVYIIFTYDNLYYNMISSH